VRIEMSEYKKYYTIQIDQDLSNCQKNIWYKNKPGAIFQTHLEVHRNGEGTVAVFKLCEAPFFHVYPQNCTVIDEKTIKIRD
jgi:hypothetical protein